MNALRKAPALALAAIVVLPLLTIAPAHAERVKKKDATPECALPRQELPEQHQRFLEDAELLLSDEEIAVFVCLREGYQRDAFIARFWKARDTYPDTARNEFRERWEERLLAVRQLFDSPDDVRARFFLINGPPPIQERVCPPRSNTKIEAWFYGFADLAAVNLAIVERRLRRDQLAVIFYVPFGGKTWRVWVPGDPLAAFSPVDASQPHPDFRGAAVDPDSLGGGCNREILRLATQLIVLRQQLSGSALSFAYEQLIADKLKPKEPPSDEWLLTFESYLTDRPEEATPLDAELKLDYPGRRQSRTIVQLLATVDTEGAVAAEVMGYDAFDFEVIGEVLRAEQATGDEQLFETFRYRFDFPTDRVTEHRVPLVMQRYLRPGPYRLVMRIDDLNSDAVFRESREIEVPVVEDSPAPVSADVAGIFDEANRGLRGGEPTLEIVAPESDLLSGYRRFETIGTGPIDTVVFTLDGAEVFRRHRPPYSVDLDLGKLPKSQLLRAVGLDAEGREIASDALLVNGSPHRFAVRLIDPVAGSHHSQSVRARVSVTVPERRTLERVELYRNEDLIATLYQEPFTQPIELPDGDQLTVIRAVGVLTDQTEVEDTVIINGPAAIEEVRVDFVELYTTVTDHDGRPVLGLGEQDFAVFEDGVPQEIRRFERVEDTPIRGAIMLDVSASMEDRLEQTVSAAARFFEDVVHDQDELAVVTFNDRPTMAASFTGDLVQLGKGLVGLRAERGTALYDSLIYTLYHLNGLTGQRVVLLLSDGQDEHSRFSFDDALEYARRSEAAIYAIGIDLPKKGPDNPRKVLDTLAGETGGRAFFLDDLSTLDAVYQTIAKELRSKYLLAYQSTNGEDDSQFRRIEVKVASKGAEARTLRGYYP